MTWLTALGLLKRYWWAPIIVGLIAAFAISRADNRHLKKLLAKEQQAHATDLANIRAATAKAIADNLAEVRAKEGDAAKLTEDKQHDLESQLADARTGATAYSGRMRCPSGAGVGDAGKAGSSQTASPAPRADDAGMSLVPDDDVRICAQNTVKVKGWQDWYADLRTRYNAEGSQP